MKCLKDETLLLQAMEERRGLWKNAQTAKAEGFKSRCNRLDQE